LIVFIYITTIRKVINLLRYVKTNSLFNSALLVLKKKNLISYNLNSFHTENQVLKKKLAEIMTYLASMLALREVHCDIKYVKNVSVVRLSLSKSDGNLLIHQFE